MAQVGKPKVGDLKQVRILRAGDPDFQIFQAGMKEGKLEARKEVLSYLESKYMNQDNERGSVEANAILALAKELTEFFNAHQG